MAAGRDDVVHRGGVGLLHCSEAPVKINEGAASGLHPVYTSVIHEGTFTQLKVFFVVVLFFVFVFVFFAKNCHVYTLLLSRCTVDCVRDPSTTVNLVYTVPTW